MAELRESGRLRALVVAGCLPQRYGGELAKELPEVDAFVGTGEFPRIAEILDGALAGRRGGVYVESGRTHLHDERDPRLLVGPAHSAYLKIAEGCDRICAFCAIPGIRGRFQSRTLESLVAEARQLAARRRSRAEPDRAGLDSWGKDLAGAAAGGRDSTQLLRALDEVDGLDWIRLLYVYPSAVTDELIAALASGQRVLPYVDIPLQHASDAMLRAMKRGHDGRSPAPAGRAAARARSRTSRCAPPSSSASRARPTPTSKRSATSFAKCASIASASSGTRTRRAPPRCELPGKVSKRVARERHRALLDLLRELQAEKLAELVGREVDVLVDAGGARSRRRADALAGAGHRRQRAAARRRADRRSACARASPRCAAPTSTPSRV